MEQLDELEALADAAEVYVWVASRALGEQEQAEMRAIHDAWLRGWSAAFACPASHSRMVLGGRILVWAVDERPRQARGIMGGLTGTELDPLFRAVERFVAQRQPPLTLLPSEALLVEGDVVPLGDAWAQLLAQGRVTAETVIVHGCTVGEWRAGHFLHRLTDDPRAALLLRRSGADGHPDLPR